DLRDAAALRTGENVEGQQERRDEARRADDEGDPGARRLEADKQVGRLVGEGGEGDRNDGHGHAAAPEHHAAQPLAGGDERKTPDAAQTVAGWERAWHGGQVNARAARRETGATRTFRTLTQACWPRRNPAHPVRYHSGMTPFWYCSVLTQCHSDMVLSRHGR